MTTDSEVEELKLQVIRKVVIIKAVEVIVDQLLSVAGNCPGDEDHNCVLDNLRAWKRMVTKLV